jgi:LytS/YehU family sensor histidine kinase
VERHERAAEALVLLSEMIRELLAWRAVDDVSLAEEVEFLGRYVALKQLRFDDRFQVTWAVDPDVAAARVPPLTMQPLVENAFRHGLEQQLGAGALLIGARRADRSLELFVENDGPVASDPLRARSSCRSRLGDRRRGARSASPAGRRGPCPSPRRRACPA